MSPLNASIVSIGEELLSGEIVDTNASYLARSLRDHGIEVRAIRCVGDSEEEIASVLRDESSRSRFLFITGGLGPTADDRTREGIASALEVPIVVDAGWLQELTDRYATRGWQLSESNVRQAERPEPMRVLLNSHGTAPGLAMFREDGTAWFAVPGVPMEMRHLMETEILPGLAQRGWVAESPPQGSVLAHGLPESVAGDRLKEFMERPDPKVGITVEGGILTVSVVGWNVAPSTVEELLDEIEARLGPAAFARGGGTLEGVLLREARAQGLGIAVAESCTGGRVSSALTSQAGASDVFSEGITTYSNEAKQRLLGVREETLISHGAVSEETAREMVVGVAARSGAELAASITGIAGPGGGTVDKPVGLVWFATSLRGEVRAESRRFDGSREHVQSRSTRTALDLMRRRLLPNGSESR